MRQILHSDMKSGGFELGSILGGGTAFPVHSTEILITQKCNASQNEEMVGLNF